MLEKGLFHMLIRSAELTEWAAAEIKFSHTVGGRWPRQDKNGLKQLFDKLHEIAKCLRKASKYHEHNSLGGPAKMFDVIADRIRAGDSMKKCMDDYGLKWKNGKKVSRSH